MPIFFPETQIRTKIEVICPSGNPDSPHKIFIFPSNGPFPSEENWHEAIESFKECPHPLKNKALRAASLGPNPYIFTDFERNINYNADGNPLGANTGIVKSIGAMFGFDVSIKVLREHDYYDSKSDRWVGIARDV